MAAYPTIPWLRDGLKADRDGGLDAARQELVVHGDAVRREAHVQAAAARGAFDQQLADAGDLRGRHGVGRRRV